MSRSIWKNPIVAKVDSFRKHYARNAQILKKFIGRNIFIHRGNTFVKIPITRERVGYKLGFFTDTRTCHQIVKSKREKKKKKIK